MARRKEGEEIIIQYSSEEAKRVNEILMNQLELIHEESQQSHGETLAHLSEAAGMVANSIVNYAPIGNPDTEWDVLTHSEK